MGAPMRYALAVASFLACWSGGAFGAEMPKELIGTWCEDDSGRLVRCKEGDDIIERSWTHNVDESCKVLSVSRDERSKDTWIVRQGCHADHYRGEKIVTIRYTRRGVYLYVSGP